MPGDRDRLASRATALRRRAAAAGMALGGGLLLFAAPPAAAQREAVPPPVVKNLSPQPPPSPQQQSQARPALPPQGGGAGPQGVTGPGAGSTAALAAVSALPAMIGGFVRSGVTDFEARAAGLGASARYGLPGRQLRADIFLYDRTIRTPIPEDPAAGPVRDEFARSVREVLDFYRSQNLNGSQLGGSFTLPEGVLCAEFTVGRPGTGRQDFSLACVAGAAGQFVKIRLTMPEADDASTIGRTFARDAVHAARGRSPAPPPAAGGARPGTK